jgi:hypothetical protein
MVSKPCFVACPNKWELIKKGINKRGSSNRSFFILTIIGIERGNLQMLTLSNPLRPGSGTTLRPGSGTTLRPGSGTTLRPGSEGRLSTLRRGVWCKMEGLSTLRRGVWCKMECLSTSLKDRVMARKR